MPGTLPITESERIADLLRHQIESGHRVPGDRLVERNIAAEFGVSRLPVRDALRILESEGYTSTTPRNGAVVRSVTSADLADIDEVHQALHCLAIRLAARRRTSQDLASLREALDTSAATDSPEERLRWAYRFRDLVIAVSRNDLIGSILATSNERVARQLPALRDFAFVEQANREILAALEAQDAERAEALLQRLMHTYWQERRRVVMETAQQRLRASHAKMDSSAVPTGPHGTRSTQSTRIREESPRKTEIQPESVRAANFIRQQLFDGRYQQGDRVSERGVAQHLGMSRIPVRQAVQSLLTEGLLVPQTRGAAATVRTIRPDEIQSLVEVQMTLDIVAARASAERRNHHQLDAFGDMVDRINVALGAGDACKAHRLLLSVRDLVFQMSANTILIRADGLIRSQIAWLTSPAPTIDEAPYALESLFDAISSRDPVHAERMVRRFHAEFSCYAGTLPTGELESFHPGLVGNS